MVLVTALAALWLSMYLGSAIKAIVGSRRFRSGERPAASRIDATLVRPCAGDEVGLADRLGHAGGASHVVFALPSPGDPALSAVETAAAALRARGTEVHIVQLSTRGPNRKAEQMAAALAAIETATRPLVFADSDVDLASIDLAVLIAPLDDKFVGAVWAPPIEAGPRTTAGDARSHAVLAATLHAFPLLALIDAHGMVGKLFATTHAAIHRAGGLRDLRLYIGEDIELARRLRLAGLRVITAPLLAPSLAQGRTRADVASRYLRWLHVVRAQRPLLMLTYPLIIAAGPAFALVALLATTSTIRSVALAGLVIRTLIGVSAHRATRSSLSPAALPWAMLQGDFVLLSACARALFTRNVTWRGVSLRLGSRGRLVEPS